MIQIKDPFEHAHESPGKQIEREMKLKEQITLFKT